MKIFCYRLNVISVIFHQFRFTFMHVVDTFIQSDLQCIQVIHVLSVHVFPGNWTHTTFALLKQCSTTEPQEHYQFNPFLLNPKLSSKTTYSCFSIEHKLLILLKETCLCNIRLHFTLGTKQVNGSKMYNVVFMIIFSPAELNRFCSCTFNMCKPSMQLQIIPSWLLEYANMIHWTLLFPKRTWKKCCFLFLTLLEQIYS